MLIQVCRYPHEDVHAALFRKGKKGKQKGKTYTAPQARDIQVPHPERADTINEPPNSFIHSLIHSSNLKGLFCAKDMLEYQDEYKGMSEYTAPSVHPETKTNVNFRTV